MVTTSNVRVLQSRKFFVVRYLNEENGIIFGIEDIFRKWSAFFDVPVQVGNIYKIKEFNDEYRKTKK